MKIGEFFLVVEVAKTSHQCNHIQYRDLVCPEERENREEECLAANRKSDHIDVEQCACAGRFDGCSIPNGSGCCRLCNGL